MKFRGMMLDDSGATTLETALTLIPFLIFILGVIQICLIAFTSFTLQYIVQKTSRTGLVSAASYNEIVDLISEELEVFDLNPQNLEVNVCRGVVEDCRSQENTIPNEFFTVKARTNTYQLLGFPFIVEASAIAKNEPH